MFTYVLLAFLFSAGVSNEEKTMTLEFKAASAMKAYDKCQRACDVLVANSVARRCVCFEK